VSNSFRLLVEEDDMDESTVVAQLGPRWGWIALRGVAAMGNGAAAAVCGNQITGNGGVGLAQVGGAVLKSEGDNMVDGNNGGAAQTSGALTALAGV